MGRLGEGGGGGGWGTGGGGCGGRGALSGNFFAEHELSWLRTKCALWPDWCEVEIVGVGKLPFPVKCCD